MKGFWVSWFHPSPNLLIPQPGPVLMLCMSSVLRYPPFMPSLGISFSPIWCLYLIAYFLSETERVKYERANGEACAGVLSLSET